MLKLNALTGALQTTGGKYMRIHDRYILKGFIASWFGSLLVFSVLILAYLFVAEMRTFIDEGAGWTVIVRYLICSFPQFVGLMLPFISLVAAVFYFHRLTAHNEVTALLSSGISRLRMAFPVLVLGFLASVSLWWWNERIVPDMSVQARAILDNEIEKKDLQTAQKYGRWFRAPNNRIFKAAWYNELEHVLHDVKLFEVDRETSMLKVLTEAPEAHWEDPYWRFVNPTYREFEDGKLIKIETPESRLVEGSPDDLEALRIRPKEMSYDELSHLVAQLSAEGENTQRFLPALYSKTAFPWACFILLFYAVSCGLRVGGEGVTVDLGLVMIVTLLYYSLFTLLLTLGEKGKIPPWTAAWGTNVLFATVGIFYFRRVNG